MIRLRNTPRALARDGYSLLSLLRTSSRLRRIARGDGRIVAGPWHSEIGFEVLYWIPMLRWLGSELGVDPARITAISRGGAGPWYRGVAGEYADLLDHRSVEELRELHRLRMREIGIEKQVRPIAAERELVREISGPDDRGYALLHPSLMYRLFHWYWSQIRPISLVTDHTSFRPLATPGDEAITAALPQRYVAVKAYFSSCFPDTAANREFLASMIESLAREHDVVLLDTGLALDDHIDYETRGARVVSVREALTPRTNLAVQSEVIAGADALIATYGGFSYLGPFLGVPSVGFYSEENHNLEHLDAMSHAARDLSREGAGGPFLVVRSHDWGRLRPALPVIGDRVVA